MERMVNRRRYILKEEQKGEIIGRQLLQQKELEEQAAAKLLEQKLVAQREQEQAAAQMEELQRQLEEQAAQTEELRRQLEEQAAQMEEPCKKRMREREPAPRQLTCTPVSARFNQGRSVHVKMDNQDLFTFFITKEQRISQFSAPLLDIGQDYSGVVMLKQFVIKLLTEAPCGLKFKVGKSAERHQLQDNLRSPDKGYSRVVTLAKIDQEINAMREMHRMGLGPALYCNGVFEGKLLLC
jgi:multidrug efflux pump subunit AcrA (membrane-fusion protein)